MKWGALRHRAHVPVGANVERPTTALLAWEFGASGSSALVGNGPPLSGIDRCDAKGADVHSDGDNDSPGARRGRSEGHGRGLRRPGNRGRLPTDLTSDLCLSQVTRGSVCNKACRRGTPTFFVGFQP